jgi:hypothetical protein
MKLSWLLAINVLLLSTRATANPTWTEKLTGSALEGPNVRLFYAYDSYSQASPQLLTTYGTSHSPWTETTGYSADTGSGVRTLKALAMCDCHVPSGGTLTYKLSSGMTFGPYYGSVDISVPASLVHDPSLPPNSVACSAECALADAVDGVADPVDGAAPIDSPIPPATGGAPGTGGATASSATGSGGATTTSATSGTPRSGGAAGSATGEGSGAHDKGGWCSFAPHARPMGSPALLLLVGLALSLWRRRGA